MDCGGMEIQRRSNVLGGQALECETSGGQHHCGLFRGFVAFGERPILDHVASRSAMRASR
jgi:hypothetical protein